MQEKICPYCEAHLDPDETCNCPESSGNVRYTYLVIKENLKTRELGKQKRRFRTMNPLEVNELYESLGKGFKGYYRVLELIEKEILEG